MDVEFLMNDARIPAPAEFEAIVEGGPAGRAEERVGQFVLHVDGWGGLAGGCRWPSL